MFTRLILLIFGLSISLNAQWVWQHPLPQGNPLFDVQFTDTQTGWAVGGNGTIIKTTNGGSEWIAQNSGTSTWLNAVFFLNSQTGWVAGDDGTILKTTDGGVSWDYQDSIITRDILAIYFINDLNGWGSWLQ
jgi:photosystem II stability/assembly factor-like uncharacterized protein